LADRYGNVPYPTAEVLFCFVCSSIFILQMQQDFSFSTQAAPNIFISSSLLDLDM